MPNEKLDEASDEICKKLIDKLPDCLRYAKAQANFWATTLDHLTT